MVSRKRTEATQKLSNAAEAALAKEAETKKGSDRIPVTAWHDSNTAIEFVVPEWFHKFFQYNENAQPNDLKRISSDPVTPKSPDSAKLLSGVKVEGGTKFVGRKISLPVDKVETGSQGENFGQISKKVGTKTVIVKRRGFRVPSVMSNAAILYWLFTCCQKQPAWFRSGSYQFQVAGKTPAPTLQALGSKAKGTADAG